MTGASYGSAAHIHLKHKTISEKGRHMKQGLKKTIAGILIAALFLYGGAGTVFANGEPSKVASLGLSAASAMASQKDVAKGLKAAAKDEYTDWLWQAVGGTEKFMTGNAEAEIPAAKDKIMKIVSTVQAIEKFAIAMTEGKYDEAAFTAIDEVVGTLNHPLVSVTWEMAKLTYESHKLVMETGAARDIEALYGIVSNDRRLMGVIDPNADAPAQIPVNAQTADYFFNKYIVTDGSARGLLKSYVTTHLGREWPEESWSAYMKSWMSVGSGVDTAQSAEIEMLAGEWRNKARGWIIQLLKEANKQATVAWAETRLRQQMAEFEEFSKRVGHFYNNDLDRMLQEFLAIKANEAAEAALKKLPEASRKAYDELAPQIKKMKDADIKKASSWEMQINNWQLECLKGSSKMIAVNKSLSEELSRERQKWLQLADQLNAAVKAKKGTVEQAVVKEYGPRAVPSGKNPTRDDLAAKRAQALYKEFFEDLMEEFDWLTIEKKIEILNTAGESEPIDIQADPQELPQTVLEQLNIGDFGGAHAIISFWKDDVRTEMRAHFDAISAQIKELAKTPPPPVASVIEEYQRIHAMVRAKGEKVDAELQSIQDQINSLPGLAEDFLDPAWPHHKEFSRLQAKEENIRMKHRRWARDQYEDINREYYIETTALNIAVHMANDVCERTKSIYEVEHKEALSAMEESLAAFKALADSLRQKIELYRSECEAILAALPAPVPLEGNYWLMEETVAQVNEGSYTYMKAPKATGPVKAIEMANFLSGMAPNNNNKYAAERLVSTARQITTKAKGWEKAERAFAELERMPADEILQARVLVDPDLDHAAYIKKIEAAIQYAKTIKAVVPKLEEAAKKAARDELNRATDADAVMEKVAMISSYFSGLEEKGLIKRSGDDYEIVVPERGWNGMIKLKEPFPHYATQSELEPFVRPVREAWGRMKAVSFAKKYAPAHVKKWESIMALSDIPVAKEDNFIAPAHDMPIYESDLMKAVDRARKTDATRKDYAETMAAIAKLVPGLMQVPSELDTEYDEKQARLYNLSLEEYYEKVKRGTPQAVYMVRENVRESLESSDLAHEMGKHYVALAKKIDTLAGEHRSHLADERARVAREANEKSLNAERRKAEEATMAQVRAQGDGALSALYGYSFQDRRVNTYELKNPYGTVILTNREVPQGTITFSARLWTIDKVRALLFSIDGGRTWKELPLSQDISFTFNAVPNTEYVPLVRIQTTDNEDMRLEFFPGVDAFVWQNIDYDRLVVETVKAIADAYERSDLALFSRYISKDYLGNRTFLEEGVRFDFDMFTDIRLTIYVNRIEQRGALFIAETKWDKKQIPRTTGEQQSTTGRTTMIFVLEDGLMKIKNLRGNLIYATLSPEIAQASGLKQSVVDDIRTARDDRNPTQPGAGEIEDAGGVSGGGGSGSTPTIKTGRSTKDSDRTNGANASEAFDFDSDQVVALGSGDINFTDENGFTYITGENNARIKSSGNTFEATTSAAGLGAGDLFFDNPNTGDVFIFMTGAGLYGKMEITNIATVGNETTITFKYALQTDGSTNVTT